MVVLHVASKVNLLGGHAPFAILAQPHQPAARGVSRSSEDLAVVVQRRGDVDTLAVGGRIIAPEELAVLGRDTNHAATEELDVLALPSKVDGDG